MNKNLEILSKPIFNLPVERENEDFIKYLEKKFDEFHKTLSEFDGELGEYVKSNSEIISCQMNCIFSSLHSYYEGKTAKAYSQLTNCLEKVYCHLWIQSKTITKDRDKYYRIRLGENKQYQKSDLFHIPFEKRNLVKRQRFSLPGLPCLYLSTSIYTCWEELNRPNINNVHASRFDLNESDVKLLFLDQRTEIIRDMIEKTYEKCGEASQMHIKKFIVSFPLLLACSIKVNDYNSDFVPEYIIPQLLLQWVNNSDDIDGIQYISNKTKYSIEPITFESEANVVIPPKTFSDIGHCTELIKTIKMTNPISYQLLEISNPTLSKIKNKSFLSKKNTKTIELLKGEKTAYSETKFGILEQKLNKMEVNYIDK